MGSYVLCLAMLLLLGGWRPGALVRAKGEGLRRALACNRLQLPAEFSAGERGLFNPAAVRHPRHGWLVTFRYDPCHTGLSPECDHTFTRPFFSSLDNGATPALAGTLTTLTPLRYSTATIIAIHKQLKTNDTLIGDLRWACIWQCTR